MAGDRESKLVRTVCKECKKLCSIQVKVEKARVVEIAPVTESSLTNDQLCWKAQAGPERLYHKDRLLHPLQRVGGRGQGRWQIISWQKALETIAARLLDGKEQYGAHCVAFIKGHYDRRCDWVSRLANAFGTPNIVGIDNTCYIPSASGRLMTYGFDGRPDFTGGPGCIMAWGNSVLPQLKQGTTLIVVNTLRTEAAKRADIWLQPRPATDLALALGILHVMINEALYDKAFVEQWTFGFDRLKNHIQSYSPNEVSRITWVPQEKIVEAARVFSRNTPACLYQGNAGEDTINSTQFARCLAVIQAISGTLDIPGGTLQPVVWPFDQEGTATDVLSRMLPPHQADRKLGINVGHFPPDDLWENIANKPAELQSQYLVDALLEENPYPIRAAFVMGANPLMTWCNSKRVHEAFSNIDFLAVADVVMTPTAALADIVLPAACYLECDGVVVKHSGRGDTCLQAQRKVVQIGECRSDLQIINALADKLGLSEYFWKDDREYLDNYLEKLGITFDELCRSDLLVSSGTAYRKYLEKGFNTPSGKVELYSTLCEKWGYEPLPDYHEPEESPFSAPEMLARYPFVLTSAHERNYIHSQDRHLQTFRRKTPEPLILIHPDAAAKLGISDGDEVFIENRRGRIKQKALLSDDVDPRVVSVAYGWWFPERGAAAQFGWDEANINILTDDSPPYSPEIGSPSMRGFLCRIFKAT